MTVETGGPEDHKICNCHYRHVEKLESHEKKHDENRADHRIMWDSIKEKVPVKYFIVLVLFVVSGLGFQMVVYDAIKSVDKHVAVIDARVEAMQQKWEARGKYLEGALDRREFR